MKYVHGLHNCYELIKSGEKLNCFVIVVFLFIVNSRILLHKIPQNVLSMY